MLRETFKIIFLIALAFVTSAIDSVDTGFRLVSGSTKAIQAHGSCRKVANNSAVKDFFIPTKSANEWNTFLSKVPADITVSNCRSCLDVVNNGGSIGNGVYNLNPTGAEFLPVYCDMTSDGGGWTRVFKHNIAGGFFLNPNDALTKNKLSPEGDLYSILYVIPNLAKNGKYRFRIQWPAKTSRKNIWIQSTSPLLDVVTAGYTPIAVNVLSDSFGGLELSNGTHGPANTNQSLLDGSVQISDWWYAIGSTSSYKGGIPSAAEIDTMGVSEVQLWMKDDDVIASYNSCKHILDSGASTGNGVYTINPGNTGFIPVYCDMTTDGGGWTRIMYHDYALAGLFLNSAETLTSNVGNPQATKYSILYLLQHFNRSGKYELRINWPGVTTLRNWWTQTSDFRSQSAAGYVGVQIDSTSNFWDGLEFTNAASSLADGSVGSGNWYYAVGTMMTWGTPPGIPAADQVLGVSNSSPRMALWVK